MLRWRPDFRLMLQHFLRQRHLADARKLPCALHIRQLVDVGLTARIGVGRKLGIHAQSLTGEKAVEALRRLRGLAQQGFDRAGPADRLFRARGPIQGAGAKLPLLSVGGDLPEGAG